MQVEFVGGPKCWNTRTFTAAAGARFLFLLFKFSSYMCIFSGWLSIHEIPGKGAFCNGEKIHVSQTDKVSYHVVTNIMAWFKNFFSQPNL